jgi:type IV pilus assembly protein PilV
MKAWKHTSAMRGFTLIEVLVTMVILSVGLLGMAALQLTGIRNNQGSAMRTQATMLAYDIVDRMRANRQAAVSGAYDIGLGAAGAAGSIAGADLIAWKAAIARTLPKADVDGNGTIDDANGSIARNGDVFTVTIAYGDTRRGDVNEENPNALNAAVQFQVRTQLRN